MSTNSLPQWTKSQEDQLARYRAFSVPAVVGLILGFLAPLAMIHPILWIVPPCGVCVNGWALWQIARNAPALCGRRVALVGLTLSLVFGTAAPTGWLSYRWLIRREARQFAMAWFEFLRQGEPHKARLMVPDPRFRPPLTDQVWDIYREDPYWREELKVYVAKPLIRTLLALGRKAQVRHWRTTPVPRAPHYGYLDQIYAVTYDDAGEKKTFFVELRLSRVTLPDGQGNWKLVFAQGIAPPEGL